MKKYRVGVRAVVVDWYTVLSDSAEEAKEYVEHALKRLDPLVDDETGEGDGRIEADDLGEYSHELGPETWTVEPAKPAKPPHLDPDDHSVEQDP